MSFLVQSSPLWLLALLLFLMLRNRAYRVCPWFFSYVVFGVAAGVARFVTLHLSRPYFATYWTTEAGYDVLGILVMYELIRMVLGSLARRSWGRLIFPVSLAAGIGLSLARAHAAPPHFSGLRYYIVVGEIAVRCVQSIIFTVLVAMVPLLRLRWRQYAFGIATGFGGYSLVALLMTTEFSDFGTRFRFLWGRTLIVAYSLAVLIWIWFFSVPQKQDPRPRAPSTEELERYQATLQQYLDWLRRMRWRCFH